MINPKEITIFDQDEKERIYRISKFPADQGREIVSQYLPSLLPKLGNYEHNEKMMFKLMCFVEAKSGEHWVALTTRQLYNNHVPDWETSLKIEAAMMEYNCSFFKQGRSLDFLKSSVQKPLASISKTLMDLSERLLQMVKQHLKS